MTFNYDEAVQRLLWLGHEGRALKWDLNNIRAILERLGRPEQTFRSLHIAGTNGKGSVAAMLDSILRLAGYRTGLYTSPHLVRINERLRVNGADIADDDFAAAFNAVEREIEALLASGTLPAHPSYFECLTTMAFWYFRQAGVELAVLEVGLGGRLDATNVVTPLVAVITQIDFDHERYLGYSLQEIAGEKASIIKPSVPVVSAAANPIAQAVIRGRAAVMDAPLVEIDTAYRVEDLRAHDAGRYEFVAVAEDGFRLRLAPALRGRFQVRNAITALAAARLLAAQGCPVPGECIAEGIARVEWPGRLERVARNPDIFLDGAHNPAAAWELARFWEEHFSGRTIHLIYGTMRDKAVGEIAELLFPRVATVVVTQADSPRAASAETLAKVAHTLKAEVVVEPEAKRALARALERAQPEDAVFVTGSLYLVGEIKRALAEFPESMRVPPTKRGQVVVSGQLAAPAPASC